MSGGKTSKVVNLPVMPEPRSRERILAEMSIVNQNILVGSAVLDDLLQRRIGLNQELMVLNSTRDGDAS